MLQNYQISNWWEILKKIKVWVRVTTYDCSACVVLDYFIDKWWSWRSVYQLSNVLTLSGNLGERVPW